MEEGSSALSGTDINIRSGSFYTERVAAIMKARAMGDKPLAVVHTYGCQQNAADGEKIKGMLSQMGFSFTDDREKADFIIFNTCAVRGHAEDRVFGNVGALKNIKAKHPSLIIALCGCMMEEEQSAERVKKVYPFVSIVFGTHVMHRLPEMLYSALTEGGRVFERGDESPDKNIVEGMPVLRDSKFKAWLSVMYGCDNFCSYCIVPYVRGRERSRTPEAVLDEFKGLVGKGYKEITLLGQNVNSYGKNLNCGINFSHLLRMLDSVEGDYRIRFMTSHPKDATHELIDTIASGKHICRSLHLPFQSGNDRVLREMNRGYTREKYLGLINYAKEKIPDISLTSDVIVGFPGETYGEFKDTVSLIGEVGFTSLFTFIYSPRNGTRAAKMPDPVPADEKKKWLKELCDAEDDASLKICSSYIGKTERVLVENKNAKSGGLTGRTDGNIAVAFDGDESLSGSFVNVKITSARSSFLSGEIVK